MNTGGDDRYHIKLAGDWLLKAQAANGDGGYAHSYSLFGGWGRSYPETTGYIIPTMLKVSEYLADSSYRDSAANAGKWLLGIQCSDGSFSDLSGNKQIFDTSQIIEGLLALYKDTGDNLFLDSAVNAGNFLLNSQDEDGKWTKYSYNNIPHTYYSRASANLLKLFTVSGESRYRVSAEKNINWVLKQQADNGYFNYMSFSADEYPYLHTIIYVLEGLVGSYGFLKDDRILKSFIRTTNTLLDISNRPKDMLYSQYDKDWQYRRKEICLTGIAQWAGLLLNLNKLNADTRYLTNAFIAIDYLKTKQFRTGNARGALPGSDPIWGSYFRFAFNNWTTKFFIDAILSSKDK